MLDYARLGLARRLLIVVNALAKILVLLILPAQTFFAQGTRLVSYLVSHHWDCNLIVF